MNHPTYIAELPERQNWLLPPFAGPSPAPNRRSHLPLSLATTLIYADVAGCSNLVQTEIARQGKRSVVIHNTLEALALLQDPRLVVDAAFVSLQDPCVDILSFFSFLHDDYPAVRRIAVARHAQPFNNTVALQTCQHDMILWDPWAFDTLSETIRDALNWGMYRNKSSWPDLRLFRSQSGADKSAIVAILGRYRHRITSLAGDATTNATDAEDIVQGAYLEILRRLPLFDGRCSPGHWIDRITRRSISAFLKKRSIGNAFHRRSGNRHLDGQ